MSVLASLREGGCATTLSIDLRRDVGRKSQAGDRGSDIKIAFCNREAQSESFAFMLCAYRTDQDCAYSRVSKEESNFL
jgi:hypothetical protein